MNTFAIIQTVLITVVINMSNEGYDLSNEKEAILFHDGKLIIRTKNQKILVPYHEVLLSKEEADRLEKIMKWR